MGLVDWGMEVDLVGGGDMLVDLVGGGCFCRPSNWGFLSGPSG